MDVSEFKRRGRSPHRKGRGCEGRLSNSRPEPERSAVNHDEQLVIDEMRELGWGCIEGLVIRDGVPRITRDTKVLRRIRKPRNAKVTNTRADRRPHKQHQKLLEECRRMGEGVMARIDVVDGLPISWKPAQRRSRRS